MNQFNNIIRKLEVKIRSGLPGWDAQKLMASTRRLNDELRHFVPDNATQSSVLIVLYPYKDSVYTLLIVRKDNGGVHGGQVSFPGGRVEEEDVSYEETALREAYEEISLNPMNVKIIGRLSSLYIPPSGYLVYPILSYVTERPEVKPDMHEADKILEADLFWFLEPKSVSIKDINVRGSMITTPCFKWDGYIIWGATAMMLNELLSMVRD